MGERPDQFLEKQIKVALLLPQKGFILNRFHIFVIRAILGAAFAVLISRFFYPRANIVYVMGLGVFLVGMAYLMEYWRGRKSK